MLKLTYTELGLHLERLSTPLELLVSQRVVLAMRTGRQLHLEPGRASFLLPIDSPGLSHLEITLRSNPGQSVTVTPVDAEFVEISVDGSWMAENTDAHEGMFITALSDRAEFFVHKLWQNTQVGVSSLA